MQEISKEESEGILLVLAPFLVTHFLKNHALLLFLYSVIFLLSK
jgi:hypothetical protein